MPLPKIPLKTTFQKLLIAYLNIAAKTPLPPIPTLLGGPRGPTNVPKQ